MAFTNGKSDNTNCTEHRWPKANLGGTIRSIGIVLHQHCNNCLALKITWESDEKVNGEWVKVRDERIIEPNLK